jgi:hypothetical protein
MKDYIFQECVKKINTPEFVDKINFVINPILEIIFSKINYYIYIAIIAVIFILILLLINLLMLIHIIRK